MSVTVQRENRKEETYRASGRGSESSGQSAVTLSIGESCDNGVVLGHNGGGESVGGVVVLQRGRNSRGRVWRRRVVSG